MLSTLARSFGVSDRWFASAPCETWPNRLFAHTGQSGGLVDNAAIPLPFFLTTVFRQLESRGRSWKVYFHDVPQTAALADLWLRIPTHFRFFDPEFLEDAAPAACRITALSSRVISPASLLRRDTERCAPAAQRRVRRATGGGPLQCGAGRTWMGPHAAGHHIRRTWRLLRSCRAAGSHAGGAPGAERVRVRSLRPARAGGDRLALCAGGQRRPSAREGPPFDHTSLIATLDALFELGPPLSPRVAAAPDLLSALRLAQPGEHGAAAGSTWQSPGLRARKCARCTGAAQQLASVGCAGRDHWWHRWQPRPRPTRIAPGVGYGGRVRLQAVCSNTAPVAQHPLLQHRRHSPAARWPAPGTPLTAMIAQARNAGEYPR